jgi:peptidoglycan/xylan/chitin deacetylase (PgdA/CDA1 family)
VNPRSLVLCYHGVGDAWQDPLSVSLPALERQVRLALVARRPGTLDDAARGRPRRLVVTFDDAYVSVQRALPALEQAGLRAAIFACTGYGDGRPLDIPELSGSRGIPEEERRTMTWDELGELLERGHEIGSHTVSHAHLTELGDRELEAELSGSRERLEDELGRPCRYLAYPYGDEDDRVRAAARAAGYEGAFGLPGRLSPLDPFSLPRVGIYRGQSLAVVGLRLSRSVQRCYEALKTA